MNDRQRGILIVVAVLIGLMILYPPFQFMGRGLGYAWIFDPPFQAATINAVQLLVQWIAVAAIGGIGLILSRNPRSFRSSEAEANGLIKAGDASEISAPAKKKLTAFKYVFRLFLVLLSSWVVGCIATETSPTAIYHLISTAPLAVFYTATRGFVVIVMVGAALYLWLRRSPPSFNTFLAWTTVWASVLSSVVHFTSHS